MGGKELFSGFELVRIEPEKKKRGKDLLSLVINLRQFEIGEGEKRSLRERRRKREKEDKKERRKLDERRAKSVGMKDG